MHPSKKFCVVFFVPGGVLLSDRLSAECVSDSAGHRRCDVTAEVFREM